MSAKRKLADGVDTLIGDELASARERFAAFNSAHEGYAVIREEVEELTEIVPSLTSGLEELWAAVRANDLSDPGVVGAITDNLSFAAERIAAEAIQVAAMAQRFSSDVPKPSS